jgi:hypothetical protein
MLKTYNVDFRVRLTVWGDFLNEAIVHARTVHVLSHAAALRKTASVHARTVQCVHVLSHAAAPRETAGVHARTVNVLSQAVASRKTAGVHARTVHVLSHVAASRKMASVHVSIVYAMENRNPALHVVAESPTKVGVFAYVVTVLA